MFIPDAGTEAIRPGAESGQRRSLIEGVGRYLGGGREGSPWRLVTILTLALATMPRWWPTGYAWLLQVPGFGLFRCPGRYMMIASLGLCLLAGRGFDTAIGARRFRAGLVIAGLYAAASFVWAFALPRIRPEFRPNLDDAAIALRVGIACVTWIVSMVLLVAWRRKPGCAVIVFIITAAELAGYYQAAGTTHWGWSTRLPEASTVLNFLSKEPGAGRIAGALDNLPLRAGLAAGNPYTGFALPLPNRLLKDFDPRQLDSMQAARWMRRLGVTHLVWDEPIDGNAVEEIFQGDDLVLDDLVPHKPGTSKRRYWRVYRIREGFPEVRLALRAREVPDLLNLIVGLSEHDGIDEAWYLTGEAPPRSTVSRAETAGVVKWEGLSGEIEHSGAVDLVLCRAHYPGWEVTINDDPPRPALRSNGGLLTARLDGRGITRVSFRYRPRGMNIAFTASGLSILACLSLIATTRMYTSRRRVEC